MTPEEFAARATAAVATVEPDASSYVWLDRNVARRRTRRRVVWATVATAAVTAVAAVAVPRDATDPAVVTTPPTQDVSPSSSPSPSPLDERHGDVDGDGAVDEASFFFETSGEHRWGIDVELASGGTVDLWGPGPNGSAITVAAVVDVNKDGRAEVVVQTSNTEHIVATLVGRHLEWVHLADGTPLRLRYENGVPTRYGWGCAEETARVEGWELYTVEVKGEGPRHVGTRTVYSLDVALAAQESSLHGSWSPGTEPVPAEFRLGVRCGTFVR